MKMNNSFNIFNLKSLTYILVVFSVLISCSGHFPENKYYESGNLKTKYYLTKNDTIKIEYYYDESDLKILKEIRGYKDRDSIKYFYKNGIVFQKGIVDKNGLKKGNWYRYTNNGFLSDVREYMIVKGISILNRKFYFTKKGDTAWYGRRFNRYNQKEFINDTLSSRNSTMNLFDFYSKDTISIDEPFAASVRCNSPLARKYNSEIMMILAKEDANFNDDFSNEREVKLDTFLNLKYDKLNQENFQKETNFNYVVVFGRWFKKPGDKILRGYMREYFERNPTENDSIVKGERRVYFEKKIYVKDTISVIDYSQPKKEHLVASK